MQYKTAIKLNRNVLFQFYFYIRQPLKSAELSHRSGLDEFARQIFQSHHHKSVFGQHGVTAAGPIKDD